MSRRDGSRFCTGAIEVNDAHVADERVRRGIGMKPLLRTCFEDASECRTRQSNAACECAMRSRYAAIAAVPRIFRSLSWNSAGIVPITNCASRSPMLRRQDRWNFNQIRDDFLRRRNGSPVLSGNDRSWTGKHRCAGVKGETVPKSSAGGHAEIARAAA
jgi:hypothetical protein